MKKLKIGITCYPTVGGSGVIATELGKMLAEKGHEIHFITSGIPFRLRKIYPNIFFHQVEVNQYSVFQYPPYDIALASKIAEVAQREQLHILHVHYAIPHAICGILAKQMVGENGFKLVTTLHGTDITVLGQDPSLTDAIRFGIEHSDYVTAVSNALVQQTYDLIQPKKKIETVYNFIDERVYFKHHRKKIKQDFHIEEHEKVVIHVSNFRAVKRVPDVIRVFHEIHQHVPSKLLLVGDGPEMRTVTQLVQDLQLEEHVIFLGKQDNLEEIYSVSDLMLLLSEKESFGLVALEAMACGVPCIGTNVGGIPEVIVDNYTGFICDLGNIEQIAAKALSLLTNEELRHQFSMNGIHHVKEHFYSSNIVQQYERIYFQLLEKEGNLHEQTFS